MKNTNYTVIIPVFNEAGNVGPLLNRLRKVIGPEPEVIVVDDGSTDSTVREVDTTKCKLIQHKVNQGKGAALRTGIEAADRDIIVFIDGDGQDDPSEIQLVVGAVQDGADLALGSRFLPTGNERYDKQAVKPVNEFGNLMITFLINLLFRLKVTDACASLRAYRAEKLKKLKIESNRYEIETEMLIRCARSHFKIVEVPVHRYAREHGVSNLFDVPFGRLRFAIRVLKTMARGLLVWR